MTDKQGLIRKLKKAKVSYKEEQGCIIIKNSTTNNPTNFFQNKALFDKNDKFVRWEP